MDAVIRSRCEQIGWSALYEQYIPNLGPVNQNGERRCVPPFPDHRGSSDTMSINVITGMWHVFTAPSYGGDYILFRAIMEAEDFDEMTGRAVPDYAAMQRKVAQELGVSKPVQPEFYQACLSLIDSEHTLRTMRRKPWNIDVLKSLGVGFDPSSNRFTLPCQDQRGRLVNLRMYQPGATVKTFWYADYASGNFLFPHRAWSEQTLVLTEGEGDAISLWSAGFPGCSGTMGAGSPVPEGNWFWNKNVFILMDADAAGEGASAEAARRIRDRAASVAICTLPQWSNRPEKADVSDYIDHLYSSGYTLEQVQEALTEVFKNAIPVSQDSGRYDTDPIQVSYSKAISSERLEQRIRFPAKVTARSSRRFIVPVDYTMSCPATGHTYCQGCPMRRDFHGNQRFIHDPRSRDTLKFIGVEDYKVTQVLMETQGVPRQCPDCRVTVNGSIDVEPTILNDAIDPLSALSSTETDRQRREAFCLVRHQSEKIEENRAYDLEGFLVAHPKTQASVFLIDRYVPRQSQFESFAPSIDEVEEMKRYCVPYGGDVVEKLLEVAEDMSESTTLIYGRSDLHIAYRTLWHSSLNFNFMGSPIGKGWLEMLVIGDTRCGKSAIFRKMAEHVGLGTLIDCKMQTVPGMLGSVIQSPSGEYYVVAGLLPQHDGGVVCLDEFSTIRYAGASLVETLSSTRSEGLVRITKAASAEFRARVRMAWLANPGLGRLMGEMASYGVEMIHEVIHQPEDIARFDFAVAVSQNDVDPSLINRVHRPSEPRYSSRSAKNLLAWTYSRRMEEILWDPVAEQEVVLAAARLCNYYDATVPLVEPAEQRKKIAKVAVSVAAQVFSTDPSFRAIVVTVDHVRAAERLFHLWFDKPAMGYNSYSAKMRQERVLQYPERIRSIFDEEMAGYGGRLAEELLRLDEFTVSAFGTIVPMQNFVAIEIIQQLYTQGCIRITAKGRRNTYEKTPAFIAWLKEYVTRQAIERVVPTSVEQVS